MAPINVINNKYTIHNNISYGNITFKGARIFTELLPIETYYFMLF
jgi:hypothetical protein